MIILRRLFFSILRSVLTLILITAILYASLMVTPAETRASLYMPKKKSSPHDGRNVRQNAPGHDR